MKTIRRTGLLTRTALGSAIFIAAASVSQTAFAQTSTVAGTINNVAANGGSPTIGTVGNTTTITANASRSIVNWNDLYLASGDTLQYVVGGRGDIVLNRVSDNIGMGISGTVRSNVGSAAGATGGNIWFSAPGGVYFGNSAVVNVGGLLATTAGVTDGDFFDDSSFSFTGAPLASGVAALNASQINVAGGTVAFIAPSVNTDATITDTSTGRHSDVLIGAAEAFTIRFAPDATGDLDLLSWTVPSNTVGSSYATPITVRGSISAGNIFIGAVSKQGLASALIDLGASLIANGAIASGDGNIILSAGGGIDNGAPTAATGSPVAISQSSGMLIGNGSLKAAASAASTFSLISARDASISVQGDLTLSGLTTTADTTLTAAGRLDVAGSRAAVGGNYSITAQDFFGEATRPDFGSGTGNDVTITDTLGGASIGNISAPGTITVNTTAGGGIDIFGPLTSSSENIVLNSAGGINVGGNLSAGGDIRLDAVNSIAASSGVSLAGRDIRLAAEDWGSNILTSAALQETRDLFIHDGSSFTTPWDPISAARDLTITALGELSLGGAGAPVEQLSAGGNINLFAGQNLNLRSDISAVGDTVTLRAGGIGTTATGSGAIIQTEGTMTAGTLTARAGTGTGSAINLAGANALTNLGAISGSSVSYSDVNGVALIGAVAATGGPVAINAGGTITLQIGSSVTASDDISLTGTVVDMTDGAIAAAGTGDVTLNAATIQTLGVNNLSGDTVTFGGAVRGTGTLSVTSDVGTIFQSTVGTGTPLTSLTVSGTGTTTLNGNVTTTGAQTYGQAVTLGAATTLTSSGNAAIGFTGTVDGAQALTINTSGATTLGGAVGATTALTSLTLGFGGATTINGGSVRTTGGQAFGDNLTLGSAATLTGAYGGFAAINGGNNDLTLNYSAAHMLNGAAITGVRNFTVGGGGETQVSGTFTTSGSQTFNNVVSLGGDATFVGSNGAFNNAISGNNHALTVNHSGTSVLGSASGLSSIQIGGGGTTSVSGAISTTGDQTYNDAVVLAGDTSIGSSTGTSRIRFNNTVDGGYDLNVLSTGMTFFSGAVGADTALASLYLNAGGESHIEGGSVTTTGAQTYDEQVSLQQHTLLTGSTIRFNSIFVANYFDLTIDVSDSVAIHQDFLSMSDLTVGGTGIAYLSGAIDSTTTQTYNNNVVLTDSASLRSLNGHAISFNSAVDGGQSLTVNTSGVTTFAGAVGSTTALASLTTDAGGSVVIGGSSVTTSGAQLYGDAVSLSAGLHTFTGSDITFAGTVSGGDPNNRSDLTVTANGSAASDNVTFASNVAGSTAIGVLTVNGAASLGGSLYETSVSQTYNGAVTLTGAAKTFDGLNGSINFNGTLNGAVGVTINSVGTSRLAGAVGGLTPLASLYANNVGPLEIGADIQTSGHQTYNSPVKLIGNAALRSSLGNIVFNGGLDGAYQLDLDAAGWVGIDSAVGSQTPLARLRSLNGSSATYLGNVSITTSGDQTYLATVLSGNASLSGANIGFGTLNGSVDPHSLTVAAAAGGSVIFSGVVGASSVPSSISVTSGITRIGTPTFHAGAVSFGTTRWEATGTGELLLRTTGDLSISGPIINGAAVRDARLVSDGGTISVSNLGIGGGFDDVTFVGATRLNGNVAASGILGFQNAVTLGTGSHVLSGGSVNFASALDGVTAGTADLIVNGPVGFQRVGGNAALASLTTNDGATIRTDITTTGAQTYNGANTLTAGVINLTSSGGGDISLGTATDGPGQLWINTAGVTRLGTIGQMSRAVSVNTDAGGSTEIGSMVRTINAQIYGDAVTLLSPTTLLDSSGFGALAFDSSVDGASALTLNTAGTTRFGANVGVGTALASITTDSPGRTYFYGGTIRTSGAQDYADGAYLTGSTAFTGTDWSALLVSADHNDLTIDTSGLLLLNGAALTDVRNLTIGGGGTTSISGTVLTSGRQTYNDTISLGSNVTLRSLGSGSAGDLTFAGIIGNGNGLEFRTGGALTLDQGGSGLIDVDAEALSVQLNGALSAGTVRFAASAGDVLINNSIDTHVLNGNVALRASGRILGSGRVTGGSISLSGVGGVGTSANRFNTQAATLAAWAGSAGSVYVSDSTGVGLSTVNSVSNGAGVRYDVVATSIGVSGPITSDGGTIALTSTDTSQGSGIALAGTVSAADAGTIVLTSGDSITQTGGGLTAGTLTGSAGRAVSLTAGDNDVASVGAFTSTDGFNYKDTNTFSVTGPISNSGTNGITLIAASQSMTLADDVTAAGQSVTLNASSGSVVQTGGIITAGTLSGFISVDANLARPNQIGALGPMIANSLVLNDLGGLDIVGAVQGNVSGGDVTIRTSGGNLRFASGGSITGRNVMLSTDAVFVNESASGAISTNAGGHWVVYAAAPSGNVFGNLNSNNNAVWNGTIDTVSAASLSGNRYVFAYQPTVTFTSIGGTKVYGTDLSGTGGYTVSGLHPGVAGAFLADTAASAFSGTPLVSSAGFAERASVAGGPYTVSIGAGTATGLNGYALAFVNGGTITVTPKNISANVSVDTKTYDRTTAATGRFDLAGALAGDDVRAGGTLTFADKNVGAGKTVTLTGGALSGADAGNYALTIPTSFLGEIVKATIQGQVTANDKIYDGTTSATGAIALGGVIAGDRVSAAAAFAFLDKNAGENKALTISGAALTGADAGNYTLEVPASAVASILKKAVTATAGVQSKIYDGTTTANGSLTLNGVLQGDSVGANAAFAFQDANAGTAKTVLVSGAALTGADAGNYSLVVPANVVADILRRAITVAANPASKVEGSADPAFGYAIASGSLVAGESLTGSLARQAGEAPGSYAIGQGTLGASANYVLTFTGSTLTIEPAPDSNPLPPTEMVTVDDLDDFLTFAPEAETLRSEEIAPLVIGGESTEDEPCQESDGQGCAAVAP